MRFLGLALGCALSASASPPHWKALPPVPDPEGFAAPFAGVSGGALLVAGGANIPGEKWKDPFVKVWHDRVHVLANPDGEWKLAGRLPAPLAYGVSITADDSLLCLGGSDSQQHHASCFRLQWDGTRLSFAPLPSLPRPCANACGALLGHTIYIAGGLEKPDSTTALHTFWALDLQAAKPTWQELEPWPGPARMLAVAAAHQGSFHLFSGASVTAGADGKPVRQYLRDAWRFTPGRGWEPLADLPRPAVAAPSPAPVIESCLAILSGDDGTKVDFTPVRDHPGFPRDALLLDPTSGTWTVRESFALSRATVPTVLWNGSLIVPNGEVRPRVRTPEVFRFQASPP
jgi:N-acetylneuraminate epimerase